MVFGRTYEGVLEKHRPLVQALDTVDTLADMDLSDVRQYTNQLKHAVYDADFVEQSPGHGRLLYGLPETHSCWFRKYADELRNSLKYLEKKLPDDIKPEFIPKGRKRVKELLKLSKSIRALEFLLLKKLNPGEVYQEGWIDSHHPSAAYMRQLGKTPLSLDEGYKDYMRLALYADTIPKEDFDESQRNREKTWVELISETIANSSRPVIIAGNNHLNNDHGLKDALAGKNITLLNLF